MTKYTNKLISPELQSVFQNNDFVLFTETWAGEFSDLSVDGFELVYLNRTERKQSAKRNSGGVALYIRDSYYQYCTVLEKSGDDIICIKIDKGILYLPADLYVCLCYVLPSGSSREAFIDLDVLDRLSNFIIKTANDTNDSYNILICGDLNSRTGTEQDYVIFDNYDNIDILPNDYVTDTYLQRHSQDKIVNMNGRKLLEFFKMHTLRICNGRLGSDKGLGKYTYVSSSGKSVVDYVKFIFI